MKAPGSPCATHQTRRDVSSRSQGWMVRPPDWLLFLWLLLLCFTGLATAQPADSSDFTGRAALVERLTAENAARKAEAEAWALQVGMPVYDNDGQQARELMALRGGRPLYYATTNVQSATSVATDQVRDTLPWDLDGAGLSVGLWDEAAARASHREFVGPNGQSRVKARDSVVTSAHATHVAGTIGAAGLDPNARGMAPGAGIESYDWDNDTGQMASRAAAGPGEWNRIYVSNHSYGLMAGWEYIGTDTLTGCAGWHWTADWHGVDSYEDWFGQYMSLTRQWDEVAYLSGYYLAFSAAGNDRDDGPQVGDTVRYYTAGVGWRSLTYSPTTCPPGDGQAKGGYETISGAAVAKNIVTVGATGEAIEGRTRGRARAAMTSFSGWGPADDGRIKPDIVANGTKVYSCIDLSNRSYDTYDGTSMASPSAAGSAILLVQLYGRLFPNQAMRASTLKGVILHTADDLGRPGPDYCYGWGLMNTRAAAELIQAHHDGWPGICIQEGLLDSQNATASCYLYADGTEPLRVTLCWTDPPAAATTAHDDRTTKLINDLDLRLIGPGGAPTYCPYLLNPNDPAAIAATGDNKVDNVEQVYVPAPGPPGVYEVRITHKKTLKDNEQRYSLISSVPLYDQHAPAAENTEMVIPKDTSVTIPLKATDDGQPDPLAYVVAQVPQHGSLEYPDGAPLAQPGPLRNSASQVVYKPAAGFTGDDSFTFYADDGGKAPFGGPSNLATMAISIKDLTIREYQVLAGGDDATGIPGYQPVTGKFLWVGQYSSALRFQSVDLPKDAQILHAHLQLHAGGVSRSHGAIHGEATSDPRDFTSGNPRLYDRPRTQASVTWNWTGTESVGGWYSSPDVAAVIQEIVTRPDWSPGNALVILYVGSDLGGQGTYFDSWEANSECAAKIDITYTRSSGGPVSPTTPGEAPPHAANQELYVAAGVPAALDLVATDDGLPEPLTYTIVTRPGHGVLEDPSGATLTPPAALLPGSRVIYRSDAGFTGDDSFTFCARDGGSPPTGGSSNTATVTLRVRYMVTRQFQVIAEPDDAYGAAGDPLVISDLLSVGQYDSAMRFRNIDIPPGDEIVSANLRLRMSTASIERRLEGRLSAEAVGDADDFNQPGRRIADLPRTQASTPWTWEVGDTWPAGTFCRSPDIGAILQEIIDRPDWSIGSAVAVLYLGDGKPGQNLEVFACRSPYSDRAAKLEITYGFQGTTLLPPSFNQMVPEAADVTVEAAFDQAVTVALSATDDGLPDPPGRLTYTIASLPQYGTLEYPGGGPITQPGVLPDFGDRVVYQPQAGFMGRDSFTFYADDGALPPSSGRSNLATIAIAVRPPLTPRLTGSFQINKSEDDAIATPASKSNSFTGRTLLVGRNTSGMRFTGVNIPQGSKILEAHLRIYLPAQWLFQGVFGIVQAEAVGDAPSFSGAQRQVCELLLTDAFAEWVWGPGPHDDNYPQGSWYTSPQLKEVIQELVDRPDWAAGNAIAIVFWSRNIPAVADLEFLAFDNAPATPHFAPKLEIIYAANENPGPVVEIPSHVAEYPPTAMNANVLAVRDTPLPVTLEAIDDGLPYPPGKLTYAIASLPSHGVLELPAGGTITGPGPIADFKNQVVYRARPGFLGEDSFTFYGDDGGTAPSGGKSNTATIMIPVRKALPAPVTREFQVAAREDDAYAYLSTSPAGKSNRVFETTYQLRDECAFGVRFTDVSIPPRSRIISACLKVYMCFTALHHLPSTVRAEATGSALDFVDNSRYLYDLPKTRASMRWTWTAGPDWHSNHWRIIPDIGPTVQEVVNRWDGAAGNAIALICEGKKVSGDPSGPRYEFSSFEADPRYAAKLEVTYEDEE